MTREYDHTLKKEDYEEPRCLLSDPGQYEGKGIIQVPQQRILQKMDEYMSRKDYAGAQRHLLFWLEEAKAGNDLRGELLVCNELIGHYRKSGNREEALRFTDRAITLLEELDFAGTVSAGTTYVNSATACHAFGEYERAREFFMQAREVYEGRTDTAAHLLGGLYNNMALNAVSLGLYEDALSLYQNAMQQMRTVPGGELEQAITCLNMADLLDSQYGMETKEQEINALVEEAWELLEHTSAPKDGYYAFVCEKCAPSFSYYGYFQAAQELEQRSNAIYKAEE